MRDRSPRGSSALMHRDPPSTSLVRSESEPYVRLVSSPTSPGSAGGGESDGPCSSDEWSQPPSASAKSPDGSAPRRTAPTGGAWSVPRSQSLNVGRPITLNTEPFSLISLAQDINEENGVRTAGCSAGGAIQRLSAILRPVGTAGIPIRRHSSNASDASNASSAAPTDPGVGSKRSLHFGGPPHATASNPSSDLETDWALPRSDSCWSVDGDIGTELAAINGQLGDHSLTLERREELTTQAAALRHRLEQVMLNPRMGGLPPSSGGRFGADLYTSASRLGVRRSSENLGMDREHLVHEVLQANESKLEGLVARVASPPRLAMEPAAAQSPGAKERGLGSVSQYQFGQHGSVPQHYQQPPNMPVWGAPSTAWAEPMRSSWSAAPAPEFPVAARSVDVGQEADHTPERYSKIKRIGGGAFSNIWMGFDRKNDVRVAIKVIDKVAQFPSAADSEFAISQSLHHHHVLKCLGRFQVNCQEHLLFQLCNEGDLFDRLESSEYDQDEEQCKLYIQQAADGLEYMHSRNLVHFDVKLENMLLHNNIIKICDFGLSGCHRSIRVGKPHGTCAYMPPELIRISTSTAQYAVLKSADVWAFAIVMYAVIFADLPWQKALDVNQPNCDPDYADFVTSCDQYLISKMQPWSLLATNMQATMFRMLAPDPRDRSSMSEVAAEVRGRWLNDMDDMMPPETSESPAPASRTEGTHVHGGPGFQEMVEGEVAVAAVDAATQ